MTGMNRDSIPGTPGYSEASLALPHSLPWLQLHRVLFQELSGPVFILLCFVFFFFYLLSFYLLNITDLP